MSSSIHKQQREAHQHAGQDLSRLATSCVEHKPLLLRPDLARSIGPRISPVFSRDDPISSNFVSSTVAPSRANFENRSIPAAGASLAQCTTTYTSTSDFAPTKFTTSSGKTAVTSHQSERQPSVTAHNGKPPPILIPPPTLTERDISRIPTPLSGRADHKGHLFPFSRSPSPRTLHEYSSPFKGKRRAFSSSSDGEEFFGHLEQIRSASPASSSAASGRSPYGSSRMHNEGVNVGRYPTSPLSPKPNAKQGLSPQNSQRRGNHGRQASRNMNLNLGRFHPSNFVQSDTFSAPTSQAPQITYSRAPPPMQIESPRLMREKHREFIEKARLSSKLAASPLSIKPDAPRLDPLGSPKGAVTPLELEEAGDYFSTAGVGRVSPAASPGARSPRAASVTSEDESKPMNKRPTRAVPA